MAEHLFKFLKKMHSLFLFMAMPVYDAYLRIRSSLGQTVIKQQTLIGQ